MRPTTILVLLAVVAALLAAYLVIFGHNGVGDAIAHALTGR